MTGEIKAIGQIEGGMETAQSGMLDVVNSVRNQDTSQSSLCGSSMDVDDTVLEGGNTKGNAVHIDLE